MKKAISIVILICFIFTSLIGQNPVFAQDFHLPEPGVMVPLSFQFNPPILKGIKVDPDNPFKFDFILDKGDSKETNEQLKANSLKLIKYFLTSLTIPEKDLWVNLSPYEKDRIVPESFGLTEMGRDLLAEDYMLKQITASLIYPEGESGKKFWKRIYEEAAKKYGTTNISVNTFNKVWIIPAKAIVYENPKTSTAYVVESKLNVMLEQDYISLEKHEGIEAPLKETNQLGSKIVREIVIPSLIKEVNENNNFSQLRQVYNSLILAAWYKKKIKDSILSQVYADKYKVSGIKIRDQLNTDKIYQQYLQAFKKGVYNYVKDEPDPLTHQSIPRKYFSGGANLSLAPIGSQAVFKVSNSFKTESPKKGSQYDVAVNFAMNTDDVFSAATSNDPLFSEIPEHGTILAFGTSSTKGVIEPEYSYPVLLERILRDYSVVNAGVASERLINIGHKNETRSVDGVSRLSDEMDRHKPSFLILWHGRTDWMDAKEEAQVENGLRKMVDIARSRNCQILLLGTFKVGESKDADVYGKIAKELRIPYLKGIEDDITGNDKLLFDKLHPNSEGNLLIAKRIANFLWEKRALLHKPNISLSVPPSRKVVFQQFDPPIMEAYQPVNSNGEVYFTVGFGNGLNDVIKSNQILLLVKVRYRGQKWSSQLIKADIVNDYNFGWYRFKAILPPGIEEYTVKVSYDGKSGSDPKKFWIWSNINISVHRARQQISFSYDPVIEVKKMGINKGPRFKNIPKEKTILMFGSSSASGVVDPLFSPSALLERMTGYKVINAGIPGERAINSTGHPDQKNTDGVSRLPSELDRYHPSLLILWHGRNDWFEGKPDEVLEEALNNMISEAKRRNVQVLLLGATKPGAIIDAQVYEKVARINKIPYLEGIMRDVLTHHELMADNIHANAEGNILFARYMAQFLWEQGALVSEPNLFLDAFIEKEIVFKDYYPPVYEDVQYLEPDRAVYLTVGFGHLTKIDQISVQLQYQMPNDPQGRWFYSHYNSEIVNDYGHGYYRFKIIIPKGVKVYTLGVSSDGKGFLDPTKHWTNLDWNIQVDRAQAASVNEAEQSSLNERTTGGIDLGGTNAVLKNNLMNDFVYDENDKSIKLNFSSTMLAKFIKAPGFVPVIISFEPMDNLKGFLGLENKTEVLSHVS